MGCSPSKSQLFAGVYNHQDKALQFGSYESDSHNISGGTEINSQAETEVLSSGLSLLKEENTGVQLQGKQPTVCDIVRGSIDIGETNVHPRGGLLAKENTDIKDDRRMKKNGCKRSRQRERLRKTVYMQSNVDLPQVQVKAHQGACAYLKHNIPKYESLLGLLEKATQTQLSLQPLVTLLSLQYEEINKVLDEIATEGEQMLQMYGNHIFLPVAQNDILQNPDISEAERNSTENSPDLLQHMLQHLIKKMRLVGDSVKESGEETGDCLGSLSQLLAEKLGAKRAAELRLQKVLACVESYALRKTYSEDTALHSEDSGIGVENERHNGSVRRCSHQERSGSTASTQSSYSCLEGSLPDQPYVNEDEEDHVDEDIDTENNNDVEEPKHVQGSKTKMTDRKITNWSPADPSQYPHQGNLQKRPTSTTFEWRDQKERNVRRPKTADDSSYQRKHQDFHLWGALRSRSADCLCKRVNDYMVQEWTRLSNDNQIPEWITKRQNPSQNPLYCVQDLNNGPFKLGLTPSLTPAFAPVPPGKNAVRRLINTFSQGGCNSSNQKPLTGPSRFRGRKRNILPIISNCRAGVSTNVNNNTTGYPLDQQFSERPDDVDVNSLPPPPPEVLMDNSFEKNEGPTGDEFTSETSNQRHSTQRRKCCASQCQQASMQIVSLLPRQERISRDSLNISKTCPNEQNFVNKSHPKQDSDQLTGHKDKEKNEEIEFFQHSQSIKLLCHSNDILTNLGSGDESNFQSFSESVGGTVRLLNKDSGEGKALTLYANNHPPISKVSRVQIPTSSYSTCQRGTSPAALPPSPTCLVNGQGKTSTASFTSQIQTRTRRDSDDENIFMSSSISMSFYDARSVFCQENQSAFPQSFRPSCRSTLPRPWGEPKVTRGRLQASCLPQTFKRSNPYNPTLTDHQRLLASVTKPHQDSEATSLNNGREEYVAETAQCPIPVSCSVSGSQEAEAKITDKRD